MFFDYEFSKPALLQFIKCHPYTCLGKRIWQRPAGDLWFRQAEDSTALTGRWAGGRASWWASVQWANVDRWETEAEWLLHDKDCQNWSWATVRNSLISEACTATWEHDDNQTVPKGHLWGCAQEMAPMGWTQESWPCPSPGQQGCETATILIQGFELAHVNVYPICELLEGRTKEVGSPQHRAAVEHHKESKWGSSISGASESRDFKPDSLQWTFAGKDVWTRGYTVTHCTFQQEVSGFFFSVFFLFCFVGEVTGWRADVEGLKRKWNWGTWCESHKKSTYNYGFFKSIFFCFWVITKVGHQVKL